MNADALREVIERLEKANGPDRETDAMIVVALDLRPEWLRDQRGEMWVDAKAAAGPIVRFNFNSLGRRSTGNPPIGDFPRYTESIDAALTTLLPGWEYIISTLYGLANTEVPLNDANIPPVVVSRGDGNVALAILEAAARARAENGGRDA